MDDILKLDNISQYNSMRGVETLHPLVSVVDMSKANPTKSLRINFGFYCVFLKDVKCGELKYGCNYYDYQEGTLVFVAPGQVVGINSNDIVEPKGWALLFHPDLIRGTSLGHNIKNYSFFSYEVNEALHLSEKERQIIIDCLLKIDYELRQSIDTHSKTLIANNIELLLNYCMRFYDRQFITRSNVNKDILQKFENLLNEYFSSEIPQRLGLPTVKYCAEKIHLSANYFGDLIKKETGKSAQEYIQLKLIDIAKERVFDTSKSIGEIAYELGFKHSQHFSRMFKNETGYTPNQYRLLN
ncbi:helix-turn-helix transcriptional regulator [uncultured Acetobacteroides sp.]|uniref:helix-turn-helix domain-containing protein n=1 Tax=uncultured Acetobacteroides sp. TaxID=1760811 RepID=UPI0029F45A63|nr:helix-turn-helix transcriptional regulator [uncultured Acetobacteroides sp.]